jgi:hypothetical protein
MSERKTALPLGRKRTLHHGHRGHERPSDALGAIAPLPNTSIRAVRERGEPPSSVLLFLKLGCMPDTAGDRSKGSQGRTA